MGKVVSSFELFVNQRPSGQTLANWLYSELRSAILEGRLKPGVKLPASRDFARRYRLSRGTVVAAFERLQDEGYLLSRVGSGTWVKEKVPLLPCARQEPDRVSEYIRRAVSAYTHPKPFRGWIALKELRPFRMRDPALREFPADLWGRIAARRARNFRNWLREEDDCRGYRPLRNAIAQYLGSSRGVNCTADQVAIVSGVQQALDLLARFLLKSGDSVWMEDPGYFGASIAFERAGANLIPVPVDNEGLSVCAGIRICTDARGAFLTPAHQFPLGMTMSLERRLEVLKWARKTGAFIIEDDYDSEFRFEGLPAPALQGLDRSSSVIFLGTFTKLLFPSLRLGYIVLPPALIDTFTAFRRGTDLRLLGLEQAILCDFITEGHFGRHLRRMRNLYGERLEALIAYGRRYLTGLFEISDTKAGLYTVGFLRNDMTSRRAETVAAAHNLETRALDRFSLTRHDPKGLLLGFAAFDEGSIRSGIVQLATALSKRNHVSNSGQRGF
jgi:GntR family transcriptional regulator/MocR family aminotransferase